MCSPYIGAALQTGGMIGGAFASSDMAKARQATLNVDADVQERNAAFAFSQMKNTLKAGEFNEQNVLARGDQVRESQITTFAANGIYAPGSASALDVLTSTNLMQNRDATRMSENTEAQAEAIHQQGINYEDAAILDRSGAGQISPGLAMTTGLLNGGATVANSWYQWNKTQNPPTSGTADIKDPSNSTSGAGWQ